MTDYLVYAEWDGNDEYKSCTSNYFIASFLYMRYGITITASDTVVQKDDSITIKGTLKDLVDNTTVSYTGDITLVTDDPDENHFEEAIKVTSANTFTTTQKLSSTGVYTFYVKIGTYTSNTLTVRTDKQPTTLTLTSSQTPIFVDESITIKTTLTDTNGNPLGNKKIELYDLNTSTTTPLTTIKTNSAGVATTTRKLTKIGTQVYNFQAKYNAEGLYNASTSNSKAVSVNKHKLHFNLNQQVVYPGNYLSGTLLDESNKPVPSVQLVFSFSDTSFTDYTAYTKADEGTIQTNPYNFTGTSITVTIKNSNTLAKYESFTTTKTIQVYSEETTQNTTITAVNNGTDTHYRNWNNLSNIITTDNQYARCGGKLTSTREAIASSSGTHNTPTPILINNMGIPVSDNATIKSMTITMNARTLCGGKGSSIQIPIPTVNLNGITSQKMFEEDDSTIKYIIGNTFNNYTTTFNNLNLKGSVVNKSNFYANITFGKNTSYELGAVEIDSVIITVTYYPEQGDE